MDLLLKPTTCRACLDMDSGTTSAYENHENITYRDMLISFCNIQIDDENYILCEKCRHETVRCYEFKMKCEQSEAILQDKVKMLQPYMEEKNNVKLEVGFVTLKSQEDNNLLLNVGDIKCERDEFSSDDEKDEVMSLAEKFGVKTLPVKKEEKPRKVKNKSKKENNLSESCKEETDDNIVEKKPGKRGRKRKHHKEKEEIQLTEDGYKKIYECPKCYYFLKTFNMMVKHLISIHQVKIEYYKEYEELKQSEQNKLNKIQIVDIKEANIIKSDQENMNKDNNICEGSDNIVSRTKEELHDDTSVPDLGAKLHIPSGNGVVKNVETCEMDETFNASDRMKLYKCLHCSYTHESYEKIKHHILKHRPEKYICCDGCKFRCSLIRRLRNHVCLSENSSIPKRYQCELCLYATTTKVLLDNHHASVHSEDRPFACHLCGYRAKIRTGLIQHITRVHEKRKNFACPVCDKKFHRSYHMKMHALTHGGDKPNVCEHCGARFIQKNNLKAHIESMHSSKNPERPFACTICNYKARKSFTLVKHMKTHTGLRPFACEICPFTCADSSTLRVHIMRHKGETRFSCSKCSYKSYTKSRMVIHERVHSGERPFQCGYCSYSAKSSQRLKNHVKSHKNEQKYHCENCPYTANYRANLLHHIKKRCGREGRRYNSSNRHLPTPHNIPLSLEGTETSTGIISSAE